MELTKEQKEYLAQFGLSTARVEAIQNTVSALKQQGEGEGRRTKEAEPEKKVEESVAQSEPEAAAEAEKKVEEPVAEKKEAAAPVNEMAEAVLFVLKEMGTKITALTAQVNGMQEQLNTVSADAKNKAEQIVAETPVLSLKELMSQAVWGQDGVAQVDGRTKLAQDAPKEKSVETPSFLGISVIDQAIAANLADNAKLR